MQEIISRADAIAQGLTNYFTGKPCKHGHVARRTSSNGSCLECQSEKAAAYRLKNPERVLAAGEKYRAGNLDRIAARKKRYEENNKEKISAQRSRHGKENREKISAREKLYREKNRGAVRARDARRYLVSRESVLANNARYVARNKEKISSYKAAWKKDNMPRILASLRLRRASDPEYRSERILRGIVYRTLKAAKAKKESRTFELLGYTPDKFVYHIERQFLRGMTWDNYGEWHIDHITPISLMIAAGETDPSVVNCLSNLRPMWAIDNLKKGASQTCLL